MALLTEQDAIAAAVRYANQIGLRGHVVESITVLPPQSATGNYSLIVGQIRPPTIDDHF